MRCLNFDYLSVIVFVGVDVWYVFIGEEGVWFENLDE